MIDKNRAYSLDALRGYAIITMVLSAQIMFGILPAWMYHCQEPPPFHSFNMDIYGITWVDLVFPFFLFSMGAAFPLSLGKKFSKGASRLSLSWHSIERGIKLTYFAIFIQHMYPYSLSSPQDARAWIIAIVSFALMFLMFMPLPFKAPKRVHRVIEYGAYAIGVALMLSVDYANGRTFSLSYSNIIILVLANMAIFGSIIYVLTINNWIARIAVLPFIMAVILGSATEGSWVSQIMNYTPLPWMYQFRFLKYLFIVLPGSVVGGYLVEWMKNRKDNDATPTKKEKCVTQILLLLSVFIVVFNLYGLFTRQLVLNLVVNILTLASFYLLLRGESVNLKFWRKLFVAGAYMLMLGLFFEAFEGGIRKDSSTFSYYFVSSGLATFALIGFSIMCDVYKWRRVMSPFVMAGQNPMIAYVATSLFIMPLFNLLGIADYLHYLETSPWLGFLRGVVMTSFAVMVAMFFTKIKWFWRT